MTTRMTCTNEPHGPPARQYVPAVGAQRQVQPMNALARLILRRKAELDATWKELADRGGFPSHTTFYALATKPVHKAPPRAETLERLARAIVVPVDVVRQAALEAAGMAVENMADVGVPLAAAEDVRIVASIVAALEEPDRAIIRDIVEQFAKRQRLLSELQAEAEAIGRTVRRRNKKPQ